MLEHHVLIFAATTRLLACPSSSACWAGIRDGANSVPLGEYQWSAYPMRRVAFPIPGRSCRSGALLPPISSPPSQARFAAPVPCSMLLKISNL
ncbi:hypothetical protein B0J13DRAFT_551420, partial [Dactylonectria estremocensis]